MNVALVTQYPDKQAGDEFNARLSGVAAFCEYQYDTFREKDMNFTVYARKDQGAPYHEARRECGTIKYCWEKGQNPFKDIFREILKDKIDVVHVHHELFLFGSLIANLFLALFLLRCHMHHIKTVLELHSVVPLDQINPKFAEDNRINVPSVLIKICFVLFHFGLNMVTDRFIVHEATFQEYLDRFYHIRPTKVDVVHLPCCKVTKQISREKARERLNLPQNAQIVMYLGFITGYKGLEILMEAAPTFLKELPNSVLYLAGGLHPRLKNDPDYLSYVEKMKEAALAAGNNQTVWRGFAPDEELPVIYAAADVVVFPYTVGMSSSGPLAQAIAYERAFLVSPAFYKIIENPACFFEPNTAQALSEKVLTFFRDRNIRKEIEEYAITLRRERQPEVLQQKILQIYRKELNLCGEG